MNFHPLYWGLIVQIDTIPCGLPLPETETKSKVRRILQNNPKWSPNRGGKWELLDRMKEFRQRMKWVCVHITANFPVKRQNECENFLCELNSNKILWAFPIQTDGRLGLLRGTVFSHSDPIRPSHFTQPSSLTLLSIPFIKYKNLHKIRTDKHTSFPWLRGLLWGWYSSSVFRQLKFNECGAGINYRRCTEPQPFW